MNALLPDCLLLRPAPGGVGPGRGGPVEFITWIDDGIARCQTDAIFCCEWLLSPLSPP